ncbi:MAG: hypothetical protein ACXVBE_07605, partial [Bdellovibrionota bacterium]
VLLIAVFLLCSSCELLDAFRPAVARQKAQVLQNQVNGSAEPEGMMSPSEKMSFHRWMVKEMIEQVLARPIKDKNEVEGWANVLSQRGSLEGIYHGLVLSSEYGEKEKGRGEVKALRFYAMEMAMLDSPASSEQDPKVKAASEKYAKENMSTSVFTMKRELGERLVREAESRKGNKETLAAWYAAIAARWAKLNVDFGLAQRNKTDEVFHFNWAKENNLGMIQWELLNKVHRLMNNYGGVLVGSSPAGK